jgi:hypothetical protein
MPFAKKRRHKTPTYKLAVIFVVSTLLITIARLFISVAVDSSAYEISRLNSINESLKKDVAFLNEKLGVMNSPQYLADRAYDLGMRESHSFLFMRLSDGKITGGSSTTDTTTNRVRVENAAEEILD